MAETSCDKADQRTRRTADRPELVDLVERRTLGTVRPEARSNSYASIIPSVSAMACAADGRPCEIPAELPRGRDERSAAAREAGRESRRERRGTRPT